MLLGRVWAADGMLLGRVWAADGMLLGRVWAAESSALRFDEDLDVKMLRLTIVRFARRQTTVTKTILFFHQELKIPPHTMF